MSSCRAAAVATFALAATGAAGCGGSERQDANEPRGTFEVEVVQASFPRRQAVAQRSTLRVQVRNQGDRTAPNVALTVKTQSRRPGGANSAFGQAVEDPRFADHERPVWIVDAGPGGGETAYTNTWALGRLAPEQTKTFAFRLTAVEPGSYRVGYEVAPGLNGRARRARGTRASGTLKVSIDDKPVDARVGDDGEVIRTGDAVAAGADR
ncbi:MAG: hypothetical protein H0V26_01735 [Solirubrobacterales bacterium]|nr:hypothetical protein [Solirubrobacterales bacterium]